MKTKTFFCLLLTLFVVATEVPAQDKKPIEANVADLLARFPANDQETFNILMTDMLSLDEQGLNIICSQVIAPGTGDDIKARYAVSGLSHYLSGKPQSMHSCWENICIRYATQANDINVKVFFIDQLAIIGGDASVEALASSVTDSILCSNVISVLEGIGSDKAAKALRTSLDSVKNSCADQAINSLVRMGYTDETAPFISWYEKGNTAVKSAALTALAMSGAEEAFPVLEAAAKKVSYRGDPTLAVSSLLLYARNVGLNGNIKKAERITKSVIDNCKMPETNHYRLAAMSILTELKGDAALPMLLKAVNDPDASIRGGVVRLALQIPGAEATKKWMAKYAKATDQAKSDIIYMLGQRGDILAVPLVIKAMEDESITIQCEAVTALAKLQKKEAVDPLLSWIHNCTSDEGLTAAADALTTILDSTNIDKVALHLKKSKEYATVMLINLLSWSGDKHYFKTILPFASSGDIAIRATATKALKNLASMNDQETLINMVVNSFERPETEALQEALAVAANSNPTTEQRSDIILTALAKGSSKEKLIPVLAYTGGDKALSYVLNEFENGNAETRDICFSTLAGWNDYSASEALYSICVSGNKTFGKAAFDAFIRQVRSAPVTDDDRLLLYKKIAPFAFYPDSRAEMVVTAGAMRSYPAFFFVAPYLNDTDANVAAWAAQALQNIALPHDDQKQGLYGEDIRKGLEKAIELMTGPDSDYEKEKIRKYLESMPQGEGFITDN